jgi:hypothetical protein
MTSRPARRMFGVLAAATALCAATVVPALASTPAATTSLHLRWDRIGRPASCPHKRGILFRAALLRTTRARFRAAWLSSDLRRVCDRGGVDGVVAGGADHEGLASLGCHERRPRGLA